MKFTPRRFLGPIGALVFALIVMSVMSLASLASAQTQAGDPPGRVARLSDLNGQVWLYSPDSGEWIGADRNRPLTSGDRLATDPGARAELQIGSTTVRLDSATELEVLDLQDDRLALQLHNGSVAAHVRDLAGAGQFELTTDEGRFVVQRAGSYRFDRDTRASHATVYSGQARYEGPNSGLPINAGQRAEFFIDAAGVAQYSVSAPVADTFSGWNNDRDRRVVAGGGATVRYVSPEMTGAEELDRYGRWEQTPDYGPIWIPFTVAVDWAPYRHGHWTWVRPWGWTWVDDAPWGFAPFHYGRWVNVRNTWCWTPGVRVQRPVYAPALVAWIGGPRADVSISIGGRGPSVGWFPLAPREVYLPSYRVSPRYVQNINITHVTNVTQITNVYNNPQAPRQFENRRFQNAITVVPAGVMTDRRPVAPAAAQMRQTPWVRELANEPGRTAALVAPPVTAPVAPVRTAEPGGVVRPPPGAAGNRPGFDRRASPPNEREGVERGPAPRGGIAEPRPEPAAQRPPAQAAQPAPTAPIVAAPAGPVTAAPATPRPALRPGTPNAPVHPELENADRRAGPQQPGVVVPPPPRRSVPPGAVERAPVAVQPPQQPPQPQAAAPIAAPARPAAVPVAPVAQEAPTMRALPVRRGEDRREDRRIEERGSSPRPQAPAVVAEPPRAPQRVEQPAPPRSAEAMRPVAPQVAAPVAPPPEMRRPEVRTQADPAKDALDRKRGEAREPREQQR